MTHRELAEQLRRMAAALPQPEELPPRFFGDQLIAMTEGHPDIAILEASAEKLELVEVEHEYCSASLAYFDSVDLCGVDADKHDAALAALRAMRGPQ